MSNTKNIGAYYNDFAGKNTDAKAVKDSFGNLKGNQYDLAKDGAFKGKTIVVLDLDKEQFDYDRLDFTLTQKALEEKGFSVILWQQKMPSLLEFEKALSTASQLWVISTHEQRLNKGFLKVITKFFNEGRGLFIWGDNDPFYKDANYILKHLFNTKMSGIKKGSQKVTLQSDKVYKQEGAFKQTMRKVFGFYDKRKAGIVKNHPITTGLEFLFEGHTIATIEYNENLTPVMYGSAGNLVTACYDLNGKRAIIDGGFTRMFTKYWDTAGTPRFVKNAAAWLTNLE